MARTDATRIWVLPISSAARPLHRPSLPVRLQLPSSSSSLLYSSRLRFFVIKRGLFSSYLSSIPASNATTPTSPIRHSLLSRPSTIAASTAFEAQSNVHFVMAPIITVRLASGLWTNPANWQIALRARGECIDWAERVFAETNADVNMYIWCVFLLHE